MGTGKTKNKESDKEQSVAPEQATETLKKKSKNEIKNEKIHALKEEEQKVLESLKDDDYEDIKSDCYTEMDCIIDMVAHGETYGAIFEGPGGVGKTYRTINRLGREGLMLGKTMSYTDSYTTPASFYIWLYKHRDMEVLIIDDVAGMMKNEKTLAFLKGALWDVNGERIITYMTTKPLQDEYGNFVPGSFRLNARLIIITNDLNRKSADAQAILTRVHYVPLNIPFKELMNILEQVARKSDSYGLALEERREVFMYIRDNATESTSLSIRSLIKGFQFRAYSKRIGKDMIWKTLLLKSLNQDETIVVMERLLWDESLNEKEKIGKFTLLTGKSRATYFRLKNKFFSQESETKKEFEQAHNTAKFLEESQVSQNA